MVDGLAGGTCQISTTLFGAAFFAGLDIVKTTQPLAPEHVHAARLRRDGRVAQHRSQAQEPVRLPGRRSATSSRNGEAKVEVLGKKRPCDKVVFERKVLEEHAVRDRGAPRRGDAARLDDASIRPASTATRSSASAGSTRTASSSRPNKWTVNYKPVTEYIRRGTNPDPLRGRPRSRSRTAPRRPATAAAASSSNARRRASTGGRSRGRARRGPGLPARPRTPYASVRPKLRPGRLAI